MKVVRISQLKLPVTHTEEALTEAVYRALKSLVKRSQGKALQETLSFKIVKKSIDARKEEICYSYVVDVDINTWLGDPAFSVETFVKKCKNPQITVAEKISYEDTIQEITSTRFAETMGDERSDRYSFMTSALLVHRPMIIGSGPAGLFCAYRLARAGLAPIVVERGEPVEERTKTVNTFFATGLLNNESNVQFGEGGAGTFSDGKLNTMIKDKNGRHAFVLETFVRFGAPEEILYLNKPHIGTDVLALVVKNMRNAIIKCGGTFQFNTKLTDLKTEDNRIVAVTLMDTKNGTTRAAACDRLVLATGHSARDTFEMLYQKQLVMEAKAFAMGVRIEHPRTMIDQAQYGKYHAILPAADYKFTHQAKNGRGVYTFCMCPGGYVVNSSSETGRTCVNGMSYSGRDGINSNSALIVTVTASDFPDATPLGGVRLQQQLEKKAFQLGEGKIPAQMYGDFKNDRMSVSWGEIEPQCQGSVHRTNLRTLFPVYMTEALIEGIEAFQKKIPDYNRYDAVISGVESRTSSPLRILRSETGESSIRGIYPCGEGAGYAGGITSAAIDGLKIAEAICNNL